MIPLSYGGNLYSQYFRHGITDFQRDYNFSFRVASCPGAIWDKMKATFPNFTTPLGAKSEVQVAGGIFDILAVKSVFPAKQTNMKKMLWHGRTFYAPVSNDDVKEGEISFLADSEGQVLTFFTWLWRFTCDEDGNSRNLYSNPDDRGDSKFTVPSWTGMSVTPGTEYEDPFSIVITQSNHRGLQSASNFNDLLGVAERDGEIPLNPPYPEEGDRPTDPQKLEGWNEIWGPNKPPDWTGKPHEGAFTGYIAALSGVKVKGVSMSEFDREGSNVSKINVSIVWDDSDVRALDSNGLPLGKSF